MSKAITIIDQHTFRALKKSVAVVPRVTALEAVDVCKEETKAKCEEAFRCLVMKAVFANIDNKVVDLEAELSRMMDEI